MKKFKILLTIILGLICLFFVFLLASGNLQKYIKFNTVDSEIAAASGFFLMGILLIQSIILTDKK